MGKDRRLGRGLSSLMGDVAASDKVATAKSPVEPAPESNVATDQADVATAAPLAEAEAPAADLGDTVGSVMLLDRELIGANPEQPRELFDEEVLEELATSIKESGLLQPIIVREKKGRFEIIAGERRFRACGIAGIDKIPAIVRETSDEELLPLALIENIQRQDLNPMEKALAFFDLQNKFGLTHEEIAQKIGSSRTNVTNYLRLLDLPEVVQDYVSRGTIAMGHARALLALPTHRDQVNICQRIVRDGMSVRQVEDLVSKAKSPGKSRTRKTQDPVFTDLEDRFREKFGTKVAIHDRGGKGRIVLEYYSNDQFNDLIDSLGI